MVHSALLRVFLNLEISLSTVETEGRDSESPNPPAGVPKPSKYGGRSEKKKGGYPHGLRPRLVNYTVNKSS